MKLGTIKAVTIVLISLFLWSCANPKCEPVYITKEVYKTPQLPDLKPTEKPDYIPQVWKDYKVFKEICLSKIEKCNADKEAVKNAISNQNEVK